MVSKETIDKICNVGIGASLTVSAVGACRLLRVGHKAMKTAQLSVPKNTTNLSAVGYADTVNITASPTDLMDSVPSILED